MSFNINQIKQSLWDIVYPSEHKKKPSKDLIAGGADLKVLMVAKAATYAGCKKTLLYLSKGVVRFITLEDIAATSGAGMVLTGAMLLGQALLIDKAVNTVFEKIGEKNVDDGLCRCCEKIFRLDKGVEKLPNFTPGNKDLIPFDIDLLEPSDEEDGVEKMVIIFENKDLKGKIVPPPKIISSSE
ncbi:MAG: hypothetical protein K0S74_485 [Chlamydiales bacterium]|jgi:cyanate lyase|nr:hypothetical protein [Chlamydiales bacterium]